MSDKIPINILNAIYTGRWAIMPDQLDLIVSIANRTHSDMEAVLATQAKRHASGDFGVRDGVAIISLFGHIVPRADLFTDISGAVNVETLAQRLGEAISADDVKAIVFNIDSPGGNITNVHEFANMIYNCRGKKPIVAYTGGLCASAAYWIASACDKIVADKTAFAGSIGVVAAWTDDSEARKKMGLTDYEVVSSQSPNKRQDYKTDVGRATLQRELDALADIFIDNVARNRDVKASVINTKFGQGGMLIAEDALRVGMIDEIGSLESVLENLLSSTTITINAGVIMKKKKVVAEDRDEEREDDIDETTSKVEDDTPEDDEESEDGEASAGEDDEQTDDDDEEEEFADASKKTALASSMAAMLASNPKLFRAIKQAGVNEERKRIKAINDIAQVYGYTGAVKSAMFDKPMSASKLALKIIKAEDGARVTAKNNLADDVRDIPNVPAGGNCDDTACENQQALASIVEGLKIGGCK